MNSPNHLTTTQARLLDVKVGLRFSNWLAEVRGILGPDLDTAMELYSFSAAFDEGMTPARAVADYRSWIDA